MTDNTLAELGESQALALTIGRLIPGDFALVGPGDDAAVVSASDGRFVVTTDTMIEGHDFRLDWSTGFDLGYKAVATNVADIAAMGAKPTALVVSLAVPKESKISWLMAFADGLNAGLTELAPGASVVGGDLAQSEKIFISVTAHGDLEGRPPVLRSGAKVGDIVAVAGTLGKAAAGLDLLRANNSATSAFDDLVNVQLRPQPPISSGILAAVAGATAMLDVSDSLAKDASRIANRSGVSIRFDSKSLQGFEAVLDQAAMRLGVSALDWVLFGGEDHSLLATFPAGLEIPKEFKPIGEVISSDSPTVYLDSKVIDSKGWDSIRG
ncbi:MAG: thiamine-phosphate kinase [Micrococcales bacterium]|nr:thiamine-phosphate kinase [Micrococcales bacterium]NBR54948.1 thiamine-phosphate kinase [Micrococcales bacterium]NBT46373.1 thiamine-phosphate kinase [Actinomycetota bacterium]NBY44119.1 thiamine-phosphate kinase [Micrococcales bacterium]